jgi:hypothetical protein
MAVKNGRKNARVFCEKMVGISFNNRPRNFYPLRNISLSGLFVEGWFWQKPGNKCDITLTERWLDQEYVMTLSGKVTRQEQEGVAIQFTGMHRDTLDMLQTTLLYESQNPTVMGEEFARECAFTVSDRDTDRIGYHLS